MSMNFKQAIGSCWIIGSARIIGSVLVATVVLFSTPESGGQTVQVQSTGKTIKLAWREPPLNNPLRGLVPYQSQMPRFPANGDAGKMAEFEKKLGNVFPHSIEFAYISMRDLMPGPNQFDWSPIEAILTQTRGRHCQCTFRVFLEYPGEKIAVPQFLIDAGVKIKRWKAHGGKIATPDYEHPELRSALKRFIMALGQRYDGDPRIAWLTIGTLGLWGEWHDYPNPKLFASKTVQTEVLDAYQSAFRKTKLHLRYPAGTKHETYASNAERPFGYHDDSFAWATIATGKPDDSWFYGALLQDAGPAAMEKWKTQPIGGEIRPEIWKCVFDDPGCAPKGQEFSKCVEHTHATWLMDSGMFEEDQPVDRVQRAQQQTATMGYRLTIQSATLSGGTGERSVSLTIVNRGVAPFYYNWPVETVLLDRNNQTVSVLSNNWKLAGVMPGGAQKWTVNLPLLRDAIDVPVRIGIRVPNPMRGGIPLRFGNQSQMLDGAGWMIVDFESQ